MRFIELTLLEGAYSVRRTTSVAIDSIRLITPKESAQNGAACIVYVADCAPLEVKESRAEVLALIENAEA